MVKLGNEKVKAENIRPFKKESERLRKNDLKWQETNGVNMEKINLLEKRLDTLKEIKTSNDRERDMESRIGELGTGLCATPYSLPPRKNTSQHYGF